MTAAAATGITGRMRRLALALCLALCLALPACADTVPAADVRVGVGEDGGSELSLSF